MKVVGFVDSKKYFKYFGMILLLGALLILNVFGVYAITGGKETHEYNTIDDIIFTIFIVVEVIIFIIMLVFLFKIAMLSKRRADEMQSNFFGQFKYAGIDSDEYEYIWMNANGSKRALVSKQGDEFKLQVQRLNTMKNPWLPLAEIDKIPTLDDVKRILRDDYNFYS